MMMITVILLPLLIITLSPLRALVSLLWALLSTYNILWFMVIWSKFSSTCCPLLSVAYFLLFIFPYSFPHVFLLTCLYRSCPDSFKIIIHLSQRLVLHGPAFGRRFPWQAGPLGFRPAEILRTITAVYVTELFCPSWKSAVTRRVLFEVSSPSSPAN